MKRYLPEKFLKPLFYTVLIVCSAWAALTWYVEKIGVDRYREYGNSNETSKALVVFDPDPFYNFDEQVCHTFAMAFADAGIMVKVASVSVADTLSDDDFNTIVLCANTYNWAPDFAVQKFIEKYSDLYRRPVVAITLGAGSTMQSQAKLERQIRQGGGILLASRTFWLLRPNDESRLQDTNVQVALDHVRAWADSLAHEMRRQ